MNIIFLEEININSNNFFFFQNVPFANTEINKEVSSLLRDCLNAPPLETYSEQSTFGDLAPVIAQTIRDLETVHIPSYNTMINSFATENDNDNNEDSS